MKENNCEVLGTDRESASYITSVSPNDIKKRELAAARKENPDATHAGTNAKRREDGVRPL